MPDQEQSTPQPPKRPEYDPAFRQTFLWRATRPEDAETLIRFGDILFTLFNEGHFWGPREDGRSLVAQETEAAAGDLDSLVDYLEELSASPAESELDPEEVALCERASGWAGRLARIVLDMKRAVATWEDEDED